MPTSRIIKVVDPDRKLLDSQNYPIQRGFYFDKDEALVFVPNPKSCLVEVEQEDNLGFFDEADFKELTFIPESDLEKVARQYEKISQYKAGWLRKYLERRRTGN